MQTEPTLDPTVPRMSSAGFTTGLGSLIEQTQNCLKLVFINYKNKKIGSECNSFYQLQK
jgi:hypothetical protein